MTASTATFSGSYAVEDVIFLLKRVQLAPTALADKERLIQSGRRHYSEMIGQETLPSAEYLRVFHAALAQERSRFAGDLLTLADRLAQIRPGEITLVSLARAGTPIGVLLTRILRRLHGRQVSHYSVSIIRDRGIDEVALTYILARHPVESLVFVDGWTGKGVIAAELRRAIAHYNGQRGLQLDSSLYTVADLCGAAAFAATCADYLIPSSVLGATISGLVSRSILNRDVLGPGDFHGCVFYEEFAAHDLSVWFVSEVYQEAERQFHSRDCRAPQIAVERFALHERSEAFLADMTRRFGVRSVHHVKPGIGEATRVLLRRVPERLLLRDPQSPAIAPLLVLAREKNVPVVVDAALPYAAAALIKELDA